MCAGLVIAGRSYFHGLVVQALWVRVLGLAAAVCALAIHQPEWVARALDVVVVVAVRGHLALVVEVQHHHSRASEFLLGSAGPSSSRVGTSPLWRTLPSRVRARPRSR